MTLGTLTDWYAVAWLVGIVGFACLTIYANISYRRFLNSMTPDEQKKYREQQHREMGIY